MAAAVRQDPSEYDPNQHIGENYEVLFRCWMELGQTVKDHSKIEDQMYRHMGMAMKKYIRREYEKQTVMKSYAV